MKQLMPNSIADVVYQKLKKRIITGKLRLGQKVLDADFVDEFKVSKTPIREALLKLKSEGLIEVLPRSGTFVFKFSEEDLRALCDTRLIIEEGALRKCFQSNNIKLLAELSQNLKRQGELIERDDFSEYLNIDREFHDIFFALANNPYLEQSYRIIFDKINVLRNYLLLTKEFMTHSIGAHTAIVDYLLQDDIDNACARLKRHIYGTFNKDYLTHLNMLSHKNG